MNTIRKQSFVGIMIFIALIAMAAGCKKKDPVVSPLVGHWGCEQYVSCRTDSLGVEHWDTTRFEVAAGCDYELFLNENGTGKLRLNNSPAFIKEFSCNYNYDAVAQTITVESSTWFYALFGSQYLGENVGVFNVEALTDKSFVASWTNHVSEPVPFFERFFIKRIP